MDAVDWDVSLRGQGNTILRLVATLGDLHDELAQARLLYLCVHKEHARSVTEHIDDRTHSVAACREHPMRHNGETS